MATSVSGVVDSLRLVFLYLGVLRWPFGLKPMLLLPRNDGGIDADGLDPPPPPAEDENMPLSLRSRLSFETMISLNGSSGDTSLVRSVSSLELVIGSSTVLQHAEG